MDDCSIAINAIKRLKRKWEWLMRNYSQIAEEAEIACKPGRPKKKGDLEQKTEPIGKIMVSIYCEAFKARYQTNPPITGHHAKVLKTLGEQLGKEEGEQFIRAYLAMNDQWFVKRNHDVQTLMGSLNKVKVFLKKGRLQTETQAVQMEKLTNNATIVQEMMSGS